MVSTRFLEVKNGDVNIDLLLHYYALMKNQQYYEVKLILSSTFMEIYKNDFKDESRNEDLSLYHRLNNRMGELKLDTIKLLEFLQPEIHKIIYDTKRKFLSLRPDENRKIHTIWKKYIESYLISIIAFYRNKFVHSGRFIMNRNDVEYFIIEKWISIQKKGLADSYGDLANLMEGSIKQKILNCQNIFNVDYQSKIFEYLIKIILLRLLDVNCCLNAEKQFSLKSEGDNDVSIHEILENFNELKDGNELTEEELYEIIEENSGRCNLNSKDYVDNFLR